MTSRPLFKYNIISDLRFVATAKNDYIKGSVIFYQEGGAFGNFSSFVNF